MSDARPPETNIPQMIGHKDNITTPPTEWVRIDHTRLLDMDTKPHALLSLIEAIDVKPRNISQLVISPEIVDWTTNKTLFSHVPEIQDQNFPSFVKGVYSAESLRGGVYKAKHTISIYPDAILTMNMLSAASASVISRDNSSTELWMNTIYNAIPLDLQKILVEEVIHSRQVHYPRSLAELLSKDAFLLHKEIDAADNMINNPEWLDLAADAVRVTYKKSEAYYSQMFETICDIIRTL